MAGGRSEDGFAEVCNSVTSLALQKMLVDGVPLLRNIGDVGCSIFLIRESRQKISALLRAAKFSDIELGSHGSSCVA